MEFIGVVHIYIYIYIYHILYYFGLFIFKNDCFIMVALKTMVNAAENGYQGHPIRNVRTGCILSTFNTGRLCVPRHHNGSLHQVREGEREANYLLH